jgi:SAM-dependent methyltransferase
MPRPGELNYYERIGAEARRGAINKPFSEPDRGITLMEAGAVLELLPPGTQDVLECGCGTGWFSYFLAKSGFSVVGQDVSAHAIQLARENPLFHELPRSPEFVVCDFEALPYTEAFDAVVFFHALHHALDERKALAAAWRALRPGGVLVAAEPGVGHSKAARELTERYDVTDRDMPPRLLLRLGRQAGFRKGRSYPHAQAVGAAIYRRRGWVAWAYTNFHLLFARRSGITVLFK